MHDRAVVAGRWFEDPQLLVELFVLVNLAGLVPDVFLAHSENQFRRSSEYVPLYFSLVAAITLGGVLPLRQKWPLVWRDVGHLIGWTAVAIGFTGVILHLDSRFFDERTIRSLTYAAPFAAPLAYTGLGLLLIANRLVEPATIEWSQWILLLALGGFFGNFVFSLTDHAQNAFFNAAESVPVISSAFAVGFLLVPFLTRVTAGYLSVCRVVLAVQAVVGVVGFALHTWADLQRPAPSLIEKVLGGAPPLAPLLFPNLVVLALIALAAWTPHLRARA